jgi:hypothetical protein
MGKGLYLGLIAALILSARPLDAQVPNFYRGPASANSPLVRAAFRALLSGPAFFFNPQADGGGDGSGSDGGSSDGSSGDGSGTDGSSSADGGDAAAAAAAAAAADAAAADAPDAIDAEAVDPATETQTVSPLDAIQAIATTDPRGGEEVSPGSTNGGFAGGPGGSVLPAGGLPPAAPVDVAINAVIVSGANSPWGAVQRAPGVRNVTVTGGIIALGKTSLPGEPPPGSPQPAWLRVVPDLRLLDGSVIPPVVPNIIDIRWLNCPIEVIENPAN